MTTRWKVGDTVEFDISGVLSGDKSTATVGCKSFPVALLLSHAERVTVSDGRFQATGVKIPNTFVGTDYVGILGDSGRTMVRFTASELETYARNIRVTNSPTDPAKAPWQAGDAILVVTDDQGTAGYTHKPKGVYVLRDAGRDGEFRSLDGARIGLYGVNHVLGRTGPIDGDFSDIALKDFVVLVRGGQVVPTATPGLKVGDRVRIANPAYTSPDNTGYVSPAAYGQEAEVVALTPSGLWRVQGGRPGSRFSQIVHEKYLTKI